MPRVRSPPEGAPSPLCLRSRCSLDTSDIFRSLPVFSTRLSTFLPDKPPLRTLLVPVSQPDRERVRQEQHRHYNDYACRGGILEDLLRTADPVVDLGGQRHVAVERAGGDVCLV